MLLYALNKSKSRLVLKPCISFSRRAISSADIAHNTVNQDLKDEYGHLDSSGQLYKIKSYELSSGVVLRDVQVCYNTYGKLNQAKDNVLIVCHALTGNSDLKSWWGSMLGPGKVFDTSKYLVLCANVLGSCYGTTGPASINPDTGKMYGMSFPKVTIRDTVKLHLQMVKDELRVSEVSCVIGGSMGGMQALEWALIGQGFVKAAVVIGCGAQHTAWQIAISEVQRQAIFMDRNWNQGVIDANNPPVEGLSVARQIAMISYRSALAYHFKFGRKISSEKEDFQVKSYLKHQGSKFVDRFDAITYIKLTEQLDSHDVTSNRADMTSANEDERDSLTTSSIDLKGDADKFGSIEKYRLSKVLVDLTRCTRMLVIGIESDVLYPLHEQQELAELIPHAEFKVIKSVEGHDGFLLEQEQVSGFIDSFLNRT